LVKAGFSGYAERPPVVFRPADYQQPCLPGAASVVYLERRKAIQGKLPESFQPIGRLPGSMLHAGMNAAHQRSIRPGARDANKIPYSRHGNVRIVVKFRARTGTRCCFGGIDRSKVINRTQRNPSVPRSGNHVRGSANISRHAEFLREHIGSARRQDRHGCLTKRQPIGHFVDRAVAAADNHQVRGCACLPRQFNSIART